MDILVKLDSNGIKTLQKMYVDNAELPYAYNFLENVLNWQEKRPNENYITVHASKNFEKTGTFVGHVQINCNQYIVFTLENSCSDLYDCLFNAKCFDWSNASTLFYAVHRKFFDTVFKVFRDKKMTVDYSKLDIWILDRKTALEIDDGCPDDVTMTVLDDKQLRIANDAWPNNFQGSFDYLKVLRDLNVAYGVVRKSDGVLLSWVFQVFLKSMNALQTKEGEGGKGYATVVLKKMTKDIAKQGFQPMATVRATNIASKKVFEKVGFEILDECYYMSFVEGEKQKNI